MADNASCRTCRFWAAIYDWDVKNVDPREKANKGTCRRYAPRGEISATVSHNYLVWPETAAHDWCGDWQKVGG